MYGYGAAPSHIVGCEKEVLHTSGWAASSADAGKALAEETAFMKGTH